MAVRKFWVVENDKVVTKTVEFKWKPGTSDTTMKVNRDSMLTAIADLGYSPLDISRISDKQIGIDLCKFWPTLDGVGVENWFRGSKVVMIDGKPCKRDFLYKELAYVAWNDRRATEGLELLHFEYKGKIIAPEDYFYFYDWLYCQSMRQIHYNLEDDVKDYNAFADILAAGGGLNCQGMTVPEYLLLKSQGALNILDSFEKFKEWCDNHVKREAIEN